MGQGGMISATSAASVPQWSTETFTIATGNTGNSMDIAGSSFIKYFLLAERVSGGTNSYAFEMNVFDASGSLLDTISNKTGSMLLAVVSVVDVNGIHIEITNNTVYDISVTLTFMSN